MRGQRAEQIAGENRSKLQLSARYQPDFSQEGYHFIELYFLNMDDRWERILAIEVLEVSGAEDFHHIHGQDLESWRRGMMLDEELKAEEAKRAGKSLDEANLRVLRNLDTSTSLSTPLALPSKLQTERWLLLQVRGTKTIKSFKLAVTLMDSSRLVYDVPIAGGIQ
jgi:hypothetical protein